MNIYKIALSLLLLSLSSFGFGMYNGFSTTRPDSVSSEVDDKNDNRQQRLFEDMRQSAVCKKAMGCQLTKEMKLRYLHCTHIVDDKIPVQELWFLMKISSEDEIKNSKIRQEIQQLAAQVPVPCRDKLGNMIPLGKNKKGKVQILDKNYKRACNIIHPFNSKEGLKIAERMVVEGEDLNLAAAYRKEAKPKTVPWLMNPIEQLGK